MRKKIMRITPQKYVHDTKFCENLSFHFASAKKIIGKGLGFFIIQITSCLVIFGSANILISHYCGPEQVTIYNISYKLFNILICNYSEPCKSVTN